MRKILCLDFDGVICDSQQECLLVGFNSYNYFLDNAFKRKNHICEIPDQIRVNFNENRYFVRPAKEYWLLMHLLTRNEKIKDQRKFNILAKFNEEILKEYEPFFFEERNRLKNDDPSTWYNLHSIYSEFLDYWDSLNRFYDIYIVTNKDQSSVLSLFDHFGIKMKAERIWGMERNISKIQKIKNISRFEKVPKTNFIFIDDHPDYVESMMNTGIDSYIASWGYNKIINNNNNLVSDLGFLINQ